jgi:enamine deaminase RidA (YjgF/YER057c/UK114 family)
MSRIEKKLEKLGFPPSTPPAAVGAYIPAIRTGNIIVTSGQLPFIGSELHIVGKVGIEVTEADAQQAARLCAINALTHIRTLVGDLDKVTRILRVEGFVQSAPGYTRQPAVLNGASELLLELFGDAGRHTRVAVGVSELPLNAAVELSLWVEVAG